MTWNNENFLRHICLFGAIPFVAEFCSKESFFCENNDCFTKPMHEAMHDKTIKPGFLLKCSLDRVLSSFGRSAIQTELAFSFCRHWSFCGHWNVKASVDNDMLSDFFFHDHKHRLCERAVLAWWNCSLGKIAVSGQTNKLLWPNEASFVFG